MAIAKLSIDIETRLATFERDMNRMSSSAAAAGKRIESSFSGVKSLFAGLAGALSVGAVASSLKTIIDDLDKLDEAAQSVGVSVESLSALNYVGRMNGVQFDDMTTALTKLSVKMQDAASGSKEASALFSDLGVKVTDSSGRLKSADVVFSEIADRFSKLEDGAAKTALAVDVFDKSGARLVPVLNQGAGGLESMRKEAEALGGIIDGKLTKQAAEFNDNMDRLAVVSSAAGRSIAAELVPFLTELSEQTLIAIKNSDGLLDSFLRYTVMKSLNFKTPTESLAALNKEAQALEDRISIGRGKSGDDEKLRRLQQEIGYYTDLAKLKAIDYAPKVQGDVPTIRPPKKPPKLGNLSTKPAAERAASFADYDLDLTQKIAAAIEKTDVVKAAELVRELEKLDQLAAAGLDPAIVKAVRDDLTGATKEAADETARLNSLLSATPTDKLQASRDDMLLLTKALTEGRIAEEQYLEAVTARLDGMSEKTQAAIGEIDEFTKAAAKNIENTLADFLYDPFSEGLDGMAEKFGQVIQRMIADAAAAQLASYLFGDMGKSGKAGGLVGSIPWGEIIGAFGFHGGGVVGSASDHSFTRAVPAALFAGARRMHGGGLVGDEVPIIAQRGERVLTKEQQRSMSGGSQTISQTLIFQGAAEPEQVKRAAAAGYRSAAGVMATAGRYR